MSLKMTKFMKGHQKVHELYKKKYFVLGGFFGVEVEGYFYFFDIHRYAMASVSSSLRASEMLLLDRDRSFRKLVGIKSYLW